MAHLKLNAIGTRLTSFIDHLNGTFEAAIVVVADLGDDKGTSRSNDEPTY
jgi:hypothetical protein